MQPPLNSPQPPIAPEPMEHHYPPQTEVPPYHYNRRKQWWLLALVIVWALMAITVLKQQDIVDWWRLRHYDAPSNVVQLADSTTMTPKLRKAFYVNAPKLDNKANFVHACPENGGEATIVLGCYHSGQNGIALLDVSDPRLSGVEEVTAAHEALHAYYERLSTKDRNKVNIMLKDYYEHGLKDDRIRTTIESYKKTEPDDLLNEMHSIFATEVPELPANLETYYQQYFTNRKAVVAYAAKYQSEFTSREDRLKTTDAQIKSLEARLKTLESDLQAQDTRISQERTRLTTLRDSGDIQAYNAGVQTYNSLIDQYNNSVAEYKSVYNTYQQLFDIRNSIAGEINTLNNALNAKKIPALKN